MFMPSDTAMISDSVLDLEFSFWTLELEMKFPTPNVTHIPEVDFIKSRLANAASIDTVVIVPGPGSRSYRVPTLPDPTGYYYCTLQLGCRIVVAIYSVHVEVD